jgi:metal-responsive CopG/Arc/MetJ family transcriptional regulator
MHSLAEIEKQQVGLRLQKYLVDEIDELTKVFSVNRTDIIVEAIKFYIAQEKENIIYDGIENACVELREIRDGKRKVSKLDTLDGLIDELENN